MCYECTKILNNASNDKKIELWYCVSVQEIRISFYKKLEKGEYNMTKKLEPSTLHFRTDRICSGIIIGHCMNDKNNILSLEIQVNQVLEENLVVEINKDSLEFFEYCNQLMLFTKDGEVNLDFLNESRVEVTLFGKEGYKIKTVCIDKYYYASCEEEG